MFNWIETHGLEACAIAFIYALITSAFPPLPPGAGWWATLIYNIFKLSGADASVLVKSSPYAQKFEKFTQTEQTKKPDGTEINTQSEAISKPQN